MKGSGIPPSPTSVKKVHVANVKFIDAFLNKGKISFTKFTEIFNHIFHIKTFICQSIISFTTLRIIEGAQFWNFK